MNATNCRCVINSPDLIKAILSLNQKTRNSYCSTTNDSISTNTTMKSNQYSMTLSSTTLSNMKNMNKNNSQNSTSSFTDISTKQLEQQTNNKLDEESNQFAYNQAALETLTQQISR